MNTLSIIELLWIFITLGGLVWSTANMLDARDNREIADTIPVREPGDAVLKSIKVTIAAEHVESEAIYLAIHGLFFLIGFVAALTPPAPPVDDQVMSALLFLSTVVVPIAFFSVQVAMIFNSRKVRRNRKRIISLRALAALSTESSGTFDYKDTEGVPGEGSGTFDMETHARRASSRREPESPAPETPLEPAPDESSGPA